MNDTAIHTSGDPPTLLDVGCGEGSFIHRMARGGWQVVGVDKFAEPAGKDTDVATSIASTIAIVGSIDEIVHPQPFDLITAWHVLEHLDNLDDLLDQIKPRLASDGTFIFAVPNARSIQARVFAGHWLHLDVPRHLIHFSFQSLQRVMEKHGFEIQRHRGSEWEYDIVGWLQSALNAMGAEQNGLLQRLGGKSTATDNGELDLLSRGFQRFISAMRFAIASGVTMLATIEVFSTGWMGRGGTLIVVARHSRDTQST